MSDRPGMTSTGTISGRPGPQPGGRQLRVVPSPATRTVAAVACVALGLSEWALLIPPHRGGPPRHLPEILADPFIRPLPGRPELVLCTPGVIAPEMGPAVLHYRHGQTRIYCPSDAIAVPAARVLSALIGQLIGGVAGPGPRVSVQPVAHDDLPRHPAAAVILGSDVTILPCANLISGELAAVLGPLCTAHIACLGHSGRRAGTAWMSPAGLQPLSPGSLMPRLRHPLPPRPAAPDSPAKLTYTGIRSDFPAPPGNRLRAPLILMGL